MLVCRNYGDKLYKGELLLVEEFEKLITMMRVRWLKRQADEIERAARDLFEHYEDRHWEGVSFHTEDHLDGVFEASKRLFAAMPEKDPLSIVGDLKRWNLKRQTDFSLDELEQLMRISWCVHDLGNFMSVGSKPYQQRENGCVGWLKETELGFLEHYSAASAEARSKKVALVLFEHLDIELLRDELQLILHLVEQTAYGKGSELISFWLPMQVMDQLSSSYLRDDKIRIHCGLIHEWIGEFPEMTFVPEKFFNFTYYRQLELLDDARLASVLAIWEVEPVMYQEGLSEEEVSMKEWMSNIEGRMICGLHKD